LSLLALGAASAKGEATYDVREWWQLAGQHDADLWGRGAYKHSVLRRLCPSSIAAAVPRLYTTRACGEVGTNWVLSLDTRLFLEEADFKSKHSWRHLLGSLGCESKGKKNCYGHLPSFERLSKVPSSEISLLKPT